jgi:hypothetical protein
MIIKLFFLAWAKEPTEFACTIGVCRKNQNQRLTEHIPVQVIFLVLVQRVVDRKNGRTGYKRREYVNGHIPLV